MKLKKPGQQPSFLQVVDELYRDFFKYRLHVFVQSVWIPITLTVFSECNLRTCSISSNVKTVPIGLSSRDTTAPVKI